MQQEHAAPPAAKLRLEDVIRRIQEAVQGSSDAEETVLAVQRELRACLRETGWLPDCCQKPSPDCYARHRLYSDVDDRFSMVAMVWGPGQKTPVHDHGGVWCVEGVYEGRLAITRYDRLDDGPDGSVHFQRHDRILEGIGSTGALIPPVDFHTIENPTDRNAVTIHVYGCDMKTCRVYVPRQDGAYEACEKQLKYTTKFQ